MNKERQFPIALEKIAREAVEKSEENFQFREWLQHASYQLEAVVPVIGLEIEEKIDCRLCGNCCRSLIVPVDKAELLQLAAHLEMPVAVCQQKYLEEGSSGQLVMNAIPCHFLKDTNCSIYSNRFSACRDFPPIHGKEIRNQLFPLFMHYGTCPIVYHLIEELKRITTFSAEIK